MWGYASSSVFDFGSYTGNGNADGNMISVGGSPASFLVKTTGTNDWVTWNQEIDSNEHTNHLYPNTTAAITTTLLVDINSNGVKLRAGGAGKLIMNESAVDFIYGAFGIQPMTDGSINQGRAR
jgi:hypothetical protein